MFCREQVAQLRDRLDQIRALGAELVVVGSGAPHFARAFREDFRVGFPLLVDPELTAYAAAGLRRGVRSTLGLGVARSALRALRGGHRQGKVQGDPWQQGGAFVIAPTGELRFAHVSEEAGDHADPEAILAALRDPAAGARA